MKHIHKKQGIELLSSFDIPTITLIEMQNITRDDLNKGLSVRLYHMHENIPDVKLPSIHKCDNLHRIFDFITENKQYGFLIHQTVNPQMIVSISKRSLQNTMIVFEVFENFAQRECVKYRYSMEEYDGKYYESMMDDNVLVPGEIIRSLRKLLPYIKRIPYRNYTVEMVEDKMKGILFTDLIVEM